MIVIKKALHNSVFGIPFGVKASGAVRVDKYYITSEKDHDNEIANSLEKQHNLLFFTLEKNATTSKQPDFTVSKMITVNSHSWPLRYDPIFKKE